MNKSKGLTQTLFSKARQKVLGLLYTRHESSFYTNEIIRLTNVGVGAVQRELKSLTEAGIINVKSFGNQKRYCANKDSPIFSELYGIILKTCGISDVLRELLEPFATKIKIAFIYGSIANNTETSTSDIDLMILTEELTYGEFYKVINDAQCKLLRPVNPTIYSSKEWDAKFKSGSNFITRVKSSPKIFIIGTEDELHEFG